MTRTRARQLNKTSNSSASTLLALTTVMHMATLPEHDFIEESEMKERHALGKACMKRDRMLQQAQTNEEMWSSLTIIEMRVISLK